MHCSSQVDIDEAFMAGYKALKFASEGNNGTSSTENNTSKNNTQTENKSEAQTEVIRGNSKSKIYHCPGQRDYDKMADSEYLVTFNSENEAIAAGYRKAQR